MSPQSYWPILSLAGSRGLGRFPLAAALASAALVVVARSARDPGGRAQPASP
jgi:hypothetical protein